MMARLGYLNDPERRREFETARTVYATRREWREAVYSPLARIDEGLPIPPSSPEMDVPINGHAELEALLADCREIKGDCLYDVVDLHDRYFAPRAPR